MKKSSVLLSFAITIATVFTTSGCAMQESYDSYIPDPFETFESNTLIGDDIKENTAAQNLSKYSTGGYECTVNEGKPIVYTGEKITVPVAVTADDTNEYEMSLGISAVINGTVQTLSTGGMRESNMLIFENIAPGETIEREITFDPVISSEDKGKKQLPITFFAHFNAAYIPDESYPTFGMTHHANHCLYTTISLDGTPKYTDYSYASDISKELITKTLLEKYADNTGTPLKTSGRTRVNMYQNTKTDTGVLRLSEDGTLNLNLMLYENENSGKYRVSLYKNNELITINGNDYIEAELVDGYLYTYSVQLDNIARGDFIYAAIHKNTGENFEEYASFDMTQPKLVVNSDFEVKEPERPAGTDNSSDTSDSTPQEIINNGAVVKNTSFTIKLIGYIEQDGKRLAVIENNKALYISDIDEDKRVSEIVRIEELEKQGYMTYSLAIDGTKMVIKKYEYEGDEVKSGAYYLLDSDFSAVSEVPMQKSGEFIIEDGIILNDSQKLIHEDINGSTTLCVCDYNGENKNPIYTFPDNYYDYSLATDGELVFFRRCKEGSTTESAVVINLSDGNTVIYDGDGLTDDGGGIISSEGDYIFFPDHKNTSGKFVIFDKTKKEFREIKTEYKTEGSTSSALSPDGAYIVTSVTDISAADGKTPTGTYLRIYDTKTGELFFEEEISDSKLKVGGTLLVGNEYVILSTTNGDYRIKYR